MIALVLISKSLYSCIVRLLTDNLNIVKNLKLHKLTDFCTKYHIPSKPNINIIVIQISLDLDLLIYEIAKAVEFF